MSVQPPFHEGHQHPAYEFNRPPAHEIRQQPAYEPNQQPAYHPNQQRAQNNPCSGFVSFVINIPSYVFGGANGPQLSAINVNVQPLADQQVPLIEQNRNAEQAQGATSVAIGGNQPHQAASTWEKVKYIVNNV